MNFKSVLFVIMIFSNTVFAGDRIGNGGGVWVCEGKDMQTYDIMFMDVFEARREYQLTLPETELNPLDLVQKQKSWIKQFLPEMAELIKHIEYVEKNITWIDDIINLIPDAANKITPHPSLCKQGDWKAVQLVNFTEDFRILVRRELFQSNLMTNMERAAVYLHEGIYSFLRSEYGDNTSVRSRAINGYLLSNLTDAEKVLRIQKTLKQVVDDPIQQPVNTWICGIKPASYKALYIFEASTQAQAKQEVLKACIDGETPLNGDFPGFPGGFPGPQIECKENKILCEPVTGTAKNKSCTLVVNSISDKTYTGIGRTILEAQRETMNKCLASEGSEYACYDNRAMNCN